MKKCDVVYTYRTITESKSFETRDLPALARERVQIGPRAGWIDPCYYDKHFAPKIRREITILVQETQVHAELGQTYVQYAVRLESPQAVQNQSQWRIGFDPQTQSIVLHSIKIRRGDVETEHASLERMQFLQREAGLERLSLLGRITLLLVLEDVCPGDILEYSYTISDRPRIMPEHLSAFFSLPIGTEIGKYRFLVLYSDRRPIKWKASSPKFVPRITAEKSEVCCYWMDANFVSPEPEGNVPIWHMIFPWIQVSDCPDWQTVARAVLEAWEKQLPGEYVVKMAADITSFSPDLSAQVSRAIELVQDGFRYLSVNLELGGEIPAAPDTVVRRRYGDCKDLAFLIVHLLRALGVAARPVLVHGYWQRSVGTLLPSPAAFNHVVVEYEFGNEKRWVDATRSHQGGGALNRCISDFGLGLPIDAATTGLVTVPKGSLKAGAYELKETFVLDTSGNSSFLGTCITATGAAADAFRTEFANAGIDGIAKDRLQNCANRFARASRIEPLRTRDDREANEFVVVEAFEIQNALFEHKPSRTCLFQIRSDFTAGLFVIPGLATRMHPFALPYPCHRTHTVEIDFAGLNQISVPLFQLGNQYFTFSRRARSWPNSLRLTFSLETLADSIPTDKLAEHRKNVEAIHQAATFNLKLPMGFSRGRKPNTFAALPPPNPSRAGVSSVVTAVQKPVMAEPGAGVPTPTPVQEAAAIQKLAEHSGLAPAKPMPPAADGRQFQTDAETSRTTHRHRRKLEKRSATAFVLFLLSLVALLAAMLVPRHGNRMLAGEVLLFIMLPAWVCSMIFAVFGWKRSARFPGRYTDASKICATITLALGGLMGLVVVPLAIFGIFAGINSAQRHYDRINDGGKLLDFKSQNFVFHSPSAPWQQVDERTFGSNTALAFARPEPMAFTIIATRIAPMLLDPRMTVVAGSKVALRKAMSSYMLLSEREVVYNGVAGWQIETRGLVRGRETYFVQWICATNGFGYQLTAWAPVTEKSELLGESSRLFADFELAPVEQTP